MKKRLLIDCTYVYTSELNTGIQRVVRNIAKNIKKISEKYDFDVELIILNDKKIKKIDFIPINKILVPNKSFLFFKKIYNSSRSLLIKIFPFKFVEKFFFNTKEQFGLRFLIEELLLKPISGKIPFKKDKKFNLEELELNENDILLLLDSTWHTDIFESLKYVKSKNAKIFTVIYDIIPISHPEFCDDSLSIVFKKWLSNILKYSDGYLAISNTVKQDTSRYLKREFNYNSEYFDYFTLGSDFSNKNINLDNVREEVKNIFLKNKHTYVIISTIEARKNHEQVLRVFEKLWKEKYDLDLIIIGKIGWKVDNLINKIKKHELLNKKLYMFNDIDDNELQYVYNNADVSIFPSIIEGFGLPIIEGLNNNLKVIVSDTPIHREVGKENVLYFNLKNDDSLKNIILELENNTFEDNDISIDIPNWELCTDNIVKKIINMNQKINSRKRELNEL